jgi:hypothetical protein
VRSLSITSLALHLLFLTIFWFALIAGQASTLSIWIVRSRQQPL